MENMRFMDLFDLKIANLFDKHGRISNREIGRHMNVSEATIRRRLSHMIDNDSIQFPVVLDIEEFPEVYIAVVGIRIIKKFRIQTLLEIPFVLFAVSVTGRYDVMTAIITKSRKMLSDVLKQLVEIDGITHLETFIVLDNSLVIE